MKIDLTDFFSHAFLARVYKLNRWRVMTASRFVPSDWRAAEVQVEKLDDDVLVITFRKVDEERLTVSDL